MTHQLNRTNPSLNPHHEARKREHEKRQAAERKARPWRWTEAYQRDADASIHELNANAGEQTPAEFRKAYDAEIARLDTIHQGAAMARHIRIHEIESVTEAE